ncbi:phage holin [Pueribacillus sp. YX66]|uniref:phage holin n=1 Tax=Pueribacillus sp. YX66 TaxID=3229242 RepID=UPI00358D65E0
MKQAIVRLVVLVILLVNQTLVTLGWNPLPFSEEQIYEAISSIATVSMALWAWWKNNSVTQEAQEADIIMQELKERKAEN